MISLCTVVEFVCPLYAVGLKPCTEGEKKEHEMPFSVISE